MIVTLDGKRLTEPFPTEGTLQALIDKVRQTQSEDSVIVAVAIDGQPLVGEALSERLNGEVGQVSQVDLGSVNRRQLVSDALREVAGRLGSLGEGQDQVASQLQSGDVAQAMGHFSKFLETWQLCQRSILECSGLLGRDLTAVQCEGRTVREHLNGLADKLRELRDAFDARDTVLLSDLVQYEVPDVCRNWRGIMTGLADNVVAEPAGNGAGPSAM